MSLRHSLRPCTMDIPREDIKIGAFWSQPRLLDSERKVRATTGSFQGMLWAAVAEACLQGNAESTLEGCVMLRAGSWNHGEWTVPQKRSRQRVHRLDPLSKREVLLAPTVMARKQMVCWVLRCCLGSSDMIRAWRDEISGVVK